MSRKRQFREIALIDPEEAEKMVSGEIDLERFSTVILMSMLRCQEGRENPELNAALKKVLATRPHIPTQAQSREVRKAKAHAQRHR